MKESNALALLLLNTKGRSRSTDLVSLGQAAEALKELYSSRKVVARKVGVSEETLRVYELANSLPSQVKSFVQARLIDNPEIIEVISRLKKPAHQLDFAKNIVAFGLNTEDTRAVEKFARNHPTMSFESSVNRVLKSKNIMEKRFVLVTELSEDSVRKLGSTDSSSLLSRLRKMGLSDLIACKLHGRTLVLVTGKEGPSILRRNAAQLGVDLKSTIDTLIAEAGGQE